MGEESLSYSNSKEIPPLDPLNFPSHQTSPNEINHDGAFANGEPYDALEA